eukprot:COSAG06_NODE_64325_length_258_cov_0.236025_1_plen_44_part_01
MGGKRGEAKERWGWGVRICKNPSRFLFLHRVRAVCLMETDDLPR